MNDSILLTIRKLLLGDSTSNYFDTDLLIHINSSINTLHQLGVTKADGFFIEDSSAEWSDLIEESSNLDLIKTYICLRVRMDFDPPVGSVAEAYKERIKELEWRINVEVDPKESDIHE